MDTSSGSLSIKRFDPKKMVEHCVILMVAKRRSGKSYLVRDLMYHMRHTLSAGIAMSGTESGNGFYGTWLPSVYVYEEYDEGALHRLIERQRRMTKEGTAEGVFIILDDLAFDRKVLNSKIMRELLFNGRHLKITLVLCAQYLMDLQPGLRANIDYVFALKENVYRERLFRNFFPMAGNMATFNAIMDNCTENYGALVLDNTANSSKLNECIFWYRARASIASFRIGTPAYWGFSKVRLKSTPDEPATAPSSSSSRPKSSLRIKKIN